MTNTNPRDLIRRLADEFECWIVQAEWAQTVQGSVEDIERAHNLVDEARAARRPKPPSLKEQAQQSLLRLANYSNTWAAEDAADMETIRRALEQLND